MKTPGRWWGEGGSGKNLCNTPITAEYNPLNIAAPIPPCQDHSTSSRVQDPTCPDIELQQEYPDHARTCDVMCAGMELGCGVWGKGIRVGWRWGRGYRYIRRVEEDRGSPTLDHNPPPPPPRGVGTPPNPPEPPLRRGGRPKWVRGSYISVR